ncbi:M14 family metallopeptidase [Bacteroidota bacterium]
MKFKMSFFAAFFICMSALFAQSKDAPLTVAEKSNYETTSRYNDVMSFIEKLESLSSYIRTEYIAETTEGRSVPLMIIADPLPLPNNKLINDDRIVVYIQANIHAGEVEGKEASLMLARDILLANTPDYLKDIILLITPVFNADGNEKISQDNRSYQNGPVNGVGIRYNGQNLDLNRDGIKVETPEVRGMITNILNKWDPAVSVDLHTTNGSYHEEPITFTWMNDPNGDRQLLNYMRDKMMPWVQKTLSEKYKTLNCFYGNFIDRADIDKGWAVGAVGPRYIVNYIGLRNRIAILDENYVYADFKSRVLGCYNLLKSILDYTAANKNEIKQMLKDADKRTIARGLNPADQDSIAIEYKAKPTPQKTTIRAFEYDIDPNETGWRRFKKSDRQRTISVPYYADYFGTRHVSMPKAYILTINDQKIIELLNIHGIKFERLEQPALYNVQTFKITKLSPGQRLNQGHYNNNAKGEYISETKEFPAGTIIVKTGQRLGNLVTNLFEPETEDGLLRWNFFDRYLVPQWGSGFLPYPVYKIF